MSRPGAIDAQTPGQALAIVIAMAKHDIGTREARMLLAHAAGLDLHRLADLGLEDFTTDLIERYFLLVERRKRQEPMSHILGYREFYKSRFEVSPSVLDPRPETEVLVQLALDRPFGSVLDLGVGSGAILVTLLAERPAVRGVGCDLSEPALRLCRRNAKALAVADRATLVRSDWFDGVEGIFDLVVSNPPNIAEWEVATRSPEVRAHEPLVALTGGADGLSAYRAIAARAGEFLTPDGRILLEIGPTQAAAVSGLLEAGGLTGIIVHLDLDGRDRVVEARAPSEPPQNGKNLHP